MDALDAMLESGGPSPAASLSKEKMKEIASKSSWQPPGAKADKKAAKPSAGWTKAELNALKRAVKDVDGALDKNERWKRVAERVDGRGKKECYDKYKELKAAKAAQKRTAALPEDSTFEDRLAALGIEERPAPRDAPPRGSTWTPGGAATRPRGRARRRARPGAARARKPKSTWTPGDAGGGGAAGLDPLVPVGRRRFYEASVSFSERVITNSADGAVSVFALDVDGDGAVNVLSASYNADTVAWYENDASQSFTERVITDSFDGAYSVFAIDVDGDGDVDALSASYSHDTVAWYENDGSQSFTERVITTLADGAFSVFAIDVDGDGDVDALSASYNADTVAWYENDASQSFTERVITDSFDGAYRLRDRRRRRRRRDALSASYSHDTVAWYENDGSQSFTERVITTLADGAFSVFAIDVDGDGDVDALSASYIDDTVAWYENDGSQSFTERVITNAEDGAHSVFAIDVARRVRARRPLLREARAMAPAVADGVLARDEELQRIISGATDAAAVKNLQLLRTQHRSAWCWVPARRLFVANVTAILEEPLHLAAHLDGELSAISGATPEETVVLREAKLFEYERIARLGATGRAIYFRALDFRAEDDEAPETPTRGAYVTGRAAYAALVAGLAYYVVAHGSELGNGRTRLWVRDLVSAFVIYYGIIAVVEVYFFAFLLPSLLEEHFTKFEDPTRVRRFPFATRLPTSATFFVAAWHEELHGTRVGRYCLGDAVDDGVFDGSSRAMARIYADEAWRPSPAVRVSIALLGGLTVLPFSLQEVAFEEAFTVAPVVSALLFGPLLSPGGQRGRRNVDFATAVNLVGTILALVLAYGLYRAAAAAIDACAAKRRVDEADDYDAHSWTDAGRRAVLARKLRRPRIAGGLGGALRRARPAAEDARPTAASDARARRRPARSGGAASARGSRPASNSRRSASSTTATSASPTRTSPSPSTRSPSAAAPPRRRRSRRPPGGASEVPREARAAAARSQV
ncbi:endonuclease [Aureococcus anophagefferens]|nr:endonuclease [Aureococcus anophagefferens]